MGFRMLSSRSQYGLEIIGVPLGRLGSDRNASMKQGPSDFYTFFTVCFPCISLGVMRHTIKVEEIEEILSSFDVVTQGSALFVY